MKKLAAFLALSLLTGAAWAESRITAVPSTTTSLSATARLNFAVNVPRVLYLRVGDAGATINTVNFNVGLSGSLATLPVSDQVFSGALPPALGTITATDNYGCTGTRVYPIKICPVVNLAAITLTGTVGTAYSQSVTASGGTGPYTYALTTGTLPGGLTLNGTTGAISGTPNVEISSTVNVTATDANGCTGTRSYTLAMSCPPITVNPVSVPVGLVGSAYTSTTFTATGGTAPYQYTVIAGTLPAGLTLTTAGVLSGTPTTSNGAGVSITVQARDAFNCLGTRAYTIKICPVISLSPTTLTTPLVGRPYSNTVTAAGGASPYVYAIVSGSLPAGLSLNTSTGVISGAATSATAATFTLQATDANACPASRAYTVVIAPSLTIGNLVWRDDNNNGLRDVGEPGLDGVTVQLFRTTDNYIGNGDDVQVGSNIVTAGGGLYSFSSLAAGKYFVRLPSVPAGYTMSSGVPVWT